MPVLKNSLDKKLESKLSHLDASHQNKTKKIRVAANPNEHYQGLKEERLTHIKDQFYWELREINQRLNKNLLIKSSAEEAVDNANYVIDLLTTAKTALTEEKALIKLDPTDDIIENNVNEKLIKHLSKIEAKLVKKSKKSSLPAKEKKENDQLVNVVFNLKQALIHGLKLEINPKKEVITINESDSKIVIDLLEKEMDHYHDLLSQQQLIVNEALDDEHYENLNKEELSEAFSNYDRLVLEETEKFSEENFNNWYFKHYQIKGFEIDLEQHISHYQNRLDELKVEYRKKVEQTREKIEAKNNKRLDKESCKAEKSLEKMNFKLDSYLDEISINREQEIEVLQMQQENSNNQAEKERIEELLSFYEAYDNKHLLIQDLTMQFGGLKAVDNLTVSVNRGEIFGLIGPNGAGKTTVFNCITQFYKPTNGNIYYKNRENYVSNLLDYKVHDVIRHGIVRTFQNVELIWELSVLDNLLVAAHSAYKSNLFTQILHLPSLKKEEEIIKNRAFQIINLLKLEQYMYSYPIGLPYGILKRIELARTLMLNPELIILDEPAAGLNETETIELAQLIKEIQKEFNLTIFLVEHDMSFVMDLCDRICVINFGKKIALGTPSEVQSNKLVQEAYLGGDSNE